MKTATSRLLAAALACVVVIGNPLSVHAQSGNLSLGAGVHGSSKGSSASYGNVKNGDMSTWWSPNGVTGRRIDQTGIGDHGEPGSIALNATASGTSALLSWTIDGISVRGIRSIATPIPIQPDARASPPA